jgi:hypothetical protein
MKQFLFCAVTFFAINQAAWAFSPGFDNHYQIKSKTGKCLDVVGSSKDNHAKIQAYGCHGGSNQRWYFVGEGNNYRILSLGSHRCLDLDRSRMYQKNVLLQQYGCHGGLNQQWYLETLDDGSVRIHAAGSKQCLDIGANNLVQQYPCHFGNNQKWEISDPQRVGPSTNAGDLKMLDWCYSLDTYNGHITFYPIISNAGPNRWASSKEGKIVYAIVLNSFVKQVESRIAPYPFMLTPDSTRKLEGHSVDFSPNNLYSVEDFTLYHDDDSADTNNFLPGLAAKYDGKEFLGTGQLRHKQCR